MAINFRFIGLIVAIISATVSICRFIYTVRERIKACETTIEKQQKEIDKLTNLFVDEGFRIFSERARGKSK